MDPFRIDRAAPPAQIEAQLERLDPASAPDARTLIELHETLLFLRAYPPSLRAARLADRLLFRFHHFTAALEKRAGDLLEFEEPEISGIAGTAFTAVFSRPVARRLALRHGRRVAIDWERFDTVEQMGPAAAAMLPLAAEETTVEAHPPFERWFRRASLQWLAGAAPSDLHYDHIQVPIRWKLGASAASRSRSRLPAAPIFIHDAPLIRRSEVSLRAELDSPPIPVKRLPKREASPILQLILDTSAVRYRELYGFTFPDDKDVRRADLGRGVVCFFLGVPPDKRLPLRAYHCGMFFKNGVPAGYIETLSLFERAEVGFNLYYTFREGETAWIYARLLKLFHQELGVTCFAVDPYQIGYENEEAIASGAFWFYRKLGFRPADPAIESLAKREEQRLAARPGYRTPPATLRKLAGSPMVFSESRDWDRFAVRNIGLHATQVLFAQHRGDLAALQTQAQRRVRQLVGISPPPDFAIALDLIPDLSLWSKLERDILAAIIHSKTSAPEVRCLRLMQRHARLRAAWLRLGSA